MPYLLTCGCLFPHATTADATRSQLVRELVSPALLPKLRRMVELMIDAQYAPAQQGYGALRDKALQQVCARRVRGWQGLVSGYGANSSWAVKLV